MAAKTPETVFKLQYFQLTKNGAERNTNTETRLHEAEISTFFKTA